MTNHLWHFFHKFTFSAEQVTSRRTFSARGGGGGGCGRTLRTPPAYAPDFFKWECTELFILLDVVGVSFIRLNCPKMLSTSKVTLTKRFFRLQKAQYDGANWNHSRMSANSHLDLRFGSDWFWNYYNLLLENLLLPNFDKYIIWKYIRLEVSMGCGWLMPI